MGPWSLLATAALAAGPMGTLQPRVEVARRFSADTCRWQARAAGGPVVEGDGALVLPAGAIEFRAECVWRREYRVRTPWRRMTLPAETVTAPRVRMEPTLLVVDTRVSGERAVASIAMVPAGAGLDHPDRIDFPSHRATAVLPGRYDLSIRSAEPPTGERRVVERIRVRGPRRRSLVVDVSDGQLRVDARDGPARVAALVRAERDDQTRASGSSGEDIALLPGVYRVLVEHPTAVDRAIEVREATIRPGRRTRCKVEFRTGRLQVDVVRDGRPYSAPLSLWLAGGARPVHRFTPGEAMVLSPGRYRVHAAVPDHPAGGVDVAVTVRSGRTTRRPLDVSPAELTVEVVDEAGPPRAVVIQSLTGAPVEARGEHRYRLWPGQYRAIATLRDGFVLREDPFAVDLGESRRALISVTRHDLVVRAVSGGHPVAAEVSVFVPGHDRPAWTALTGDTLRLPAARYHLRVRAIDGPRPRPTAWRHNARVDDPMSITLELPVAEVEREP